MKNLLHRRGVKLSIVAALAVTGVVLAFSLKGAQAAGTFGPDRATIAWSPTVTGFNHVQFDSFTGVPNGVGNEEDFLSGLQVGRDSAWSNPVSSVAANSEVEGQIYIDNDADQSLNASGVGVAQNVTVRVALPTGLAQTQNVSAYISASNASPQTVYDTMQITGANSGFFQLAEEAGSVQLHEQNGTVTTLTPAQEAALFSSTGVNLGSQDGCTSFVQEITFKMNVQMPQYNLLKQVRLPGQTANDWQSSITATDGETLQWSIKFNNIGATELNDVAIVDQVPAGLTVVPGSVTAYTSNFPNGTTDISPDPIQDNGRQLNIDIGDFVPLTQAELSAGDVSGQIIYNTTVSTANLACGADTLSNEAFAAPQGLGAIEDTATANVNIPCATPTTPPTTTTTATPTALVNTGPGDVVAIFGLTTVAGAVAHRLFSRRFARG